MEDPVAITIFGRQPAEWMPALDQDAPVWKYLPNVCSVKVVDPALDQDRLAPEADGCRHVLIPLLERHIRARPRGYYALCPNQEVLKVLSDKKAFLEYTKKNNLQRLCPISYETIDNVSFPVVAKPTKLNAGAGIRILRNREQYEALCELPIWRKHEFIFQHLINSLDDYCAYLFCRDGYVIWHRSYRFKLEEGARIRGPVKFPGESYTTSKQHLESITRFLIPLKYSGPCNVDYKIRQDGSLCVLEINPRLGGSLTLSDHVADLAHVLKLIIDNSVFEETRA